MTNEIGIDWLTRDYPYVCYEQSNISRFSFQTDDAGRTLVLSLSPRVHSAASASAGGSSAAFAPSIRRNAAAASSAAFAAASAWAAFAAAASSIAFAAASGMSGVVASSGENCISGVRSSTRREWTAFKDGLRSRSVGRWRPLWPTRERAGSM